MNYSITGGSTFKSRAHRHVIVHSYASLFHGLSVSFTPPTRGHAESRSYLSTAEPQTGRRERSQQQQKDPGPHVAAQPEEPQATGWAFSTAASNPPAAPSLVPVSCACARHARSNIPKCVTACERRSSKCLLAVTHAQARRLTLSMPLF